MRCLLAAMLLLTSSGAEAAPDDAYLAMRDKYIATFTERESQPLDDAIYNQHDAALQDLGGELARILGPVSVPGFSTAGRINLDTLFPSDEGFGLLDGLAFTSAEEKKEIVVTTPSLFQHWLTEHKNWWPDFENVPQEIDAALQSDVFYTQGISTDAAVSVYAEIPIVKPEKARFAVALLAGRSQDVVPLIPDEVFVSVVTSGHVFIAIAPTEMQVTAISECDKLWDDFQRRGDAAYTAYTTSDPRDEGLFDAYTKIQEDGTEAVRHCFGERVPQEAFFPALIRQAQAIADSLPAE